MYNDMGDNMKYKMVVLDLDGTLLDDEKNISEKNIKILNDLHNKSIEIVIATGRNYYMAKMLTEKIKSIEPVILANNGAIIRRSVNDELIESNYLDPEEFKKIYKKGLEYNLNPIVHVDEYFNGYDLIYEKEDYENTYKGYIKKDYNRALNKKFDFGINNILAVCYFDEHDKLLNFGVEMKENGKNKYNTIVNRNISKRVLIEFLHPEGCKWCALKKYAITKNIKANEIVTIGDDNNDIEMLQNSGLGIAMINGTNESKKAAFRISKCDNNNSGVYYELSEIFKNLS